MMLHDLPFIDAQGLDTLAALLLNYALHSTLFLAVAFAALPFVKSPELKASLLRWGVALPLVTLPTLYVTVNSDKVAPLAQGVATRLMDSPLFIQVTGATAAGMPLARILALAWALLAGARVLTFAWRLGREWRAAPRGEPLAAGIPQALLAKLPPKELAALRGAQVKAVPAGGWPHCTLRREIHVPQDVLDALSEEELTALIAHEYGHLKGQDLTKHLGMQLMERLFFFQPLVALARRRHEAVIEAAADAYCVHLTQDGLSLARTLQKVAELGLQRPPAMVGIGALGRGALSQRVEAILAGRGAPATHRQRILLSVGCALTLMVVMCLPIVKAANVSAGVAASLGSQALGEPGAEAPEGEEPEEVTTLWAGVQAMLASKQEALTACYLEAKPSRSGKLVLSVTLSAEGAISEATLSEDTLGSEALATCVLKEAQTWTFPAPGALGKTTFNIPIVFSDPVEQGSEGDPAAQDPAAP